jgi:hypothetical protein
MAILKKDRPACWASFVAGTYLEAIEISLTAVRGGQPITRVFSLQNSNGLVVVKRRTWLGWQAYASLPLTALQSGAAQEGLRRREQKLCHYLRQRFAPELLVWHEARVHDRVAGQFMDSAWSFSVEHVLPSNSTCGYFRLGEGEQCLIFRREVVNQEVMLTVHSVGKDHPLKQKAEASFELHGWCLELSLSRRYPPTSLERAFVGWIFSSLSTTTASTRTNRITFQTAVYRRDGVTFDPTITEGRVT